MKKLEFHESLKDVPLMPLHERDALANDIAENGQLFPIILLNGKVIDGRNRYLACLSRNIEPKTISMTPKDTKALIASANYFRKHWTTGERAHFAALMTIDGERGRPSKDEENTSNDVITESKAAEIMNVSVPSVQRAKAKIRGKNEKKTKPVQGSNGEEIGVDSGGVAIPSAARPYWLRKTEAQEVLAKIQAAKKAVKAIEANDPMYCEVNLNGVLADLRNATNRFAAAIPAHVCPYCKGVKPDNCKACKGRGVVSKYFWDTAVPAEMKPEIPF